MNNRSGNILLSILLGSAIIATYALCRPAVAEVVLLRNGNVIQGRILERGDRWRIAVDSGEIYLRPSDVDDVAADLDEIYRRRAARLMPNDVESHLRLAMWCARYQLIEQGRRELVIARALAPDHPLVPIAEARLDAAALVGKSDRSASESKVVSTPAAPNFGEGKTAQQELVELMQTLPGDAAVQYTRTIQPILANSCAVSGCHGMGAAENLRLYSLRRGTLTPHEALTNLRRTLSWIDYNSPGASPLLVVPSQPHGGLPAPVFSGGRLAQYRKLLAWVEAVTQKPTQNETPSPPMVGDVPPLRLDAPPSPTAASGTAPVGEDDEGFAELEAIYRELGGELPDTASQAGSSPSSGVVPAAAMQTPSPSFQAVFQRPETAKASASTKGLPSNHDDAAEGTIRDPFDPAIFNRRYHPHTAVPRNVERQR